MKTKVFEYRGFVGIQSLPNAEGLLNDPTQPGQLGFVADASKCEFSQSAIDLLKQVKKSHDDIGDVDVFQAGDGMVVFAWMGGPLKVLSPKWDVSGSSSYAPELLTATDGVEPSDEFKQFIDTNIVELEKI